MANVIQKAELGDENLGPTETAKNVDSSNVQELYSTDDESTGQRCSSHKDKQLPVDFDLERMISKTKSDSMFELRKLTYQQRPVSEFSSKQTLEEHLASRPLLTQEVPQPHLNDDVDVMSGDETASREQQPDVSSAVNISERVQQLVGAEGESSVQIFRPEGIRQEMQTLNELHVVNGVLQGPVHEEIDRTLREGIEHRQARRRPRPPTRPRPPPRPRRQAEEGEEGGDEMGHPVGRLLAPSGRTRRQPRRRVRFQPQLPTPNADGRYPVPQRDQSVIVQRLQQSPALNSLGEEARDEIVAEVGSLVSQHLVTSALSGEFRGTLELHIQSRANQISRGRVGPAQGQQIPHLDSQYSDDEGQRVSSANVRDLREEMVVMKGQLGELKQMMRVSFDLQLDIQRAIRQEVAAALAAFLSGPPANSAGASGGANFMPTSSPVPTLGSHRSGGGTVQVQTVVESGHCVICSEGVIDSVIYHCGHMCTCTACGLELKAKALKCPICRAPITDVIRAYTSMIQ